MEFPFLSTITHTLGNNNEEAVMTFVPWGLHRLGLEPVSPTTNLQMGPGTTPFDKHGH